MYLITGASDNHFKSLQNFLTSFFIHRQGSDKIIVYNLDLTTDNWSLLQKLFPECIFKVFDYSKYPSYYNININAGEYAWKSALIKECLEIIPTGTIICWMDSGNIITENLQALETLIDKCSIYSPISISGYIKSWTHQGTLEYMKCPKEFLDYRNRNGACIAFDTSKQWVRDFIYEWASLCSIKDCIAPPGSSRENHRQDQSVLSILYYFYHQKYGFHIYDDFLGYKIHNDADEQVPINLAIICLENSNLSVDKILSVLDICKTKSYDLFYYNAVLNHKKYTKHFVQFLDPILGQYRQVFLITDNDNISKSSEGKEDITQSSGGKEHITQYSNKYQSIKFYKFCDSIAGDIDKVIPWSVESILQDLCNNENADAINTLGYMKKMVNPIKENYYVQNGGLYIKTHEKSNLYITLGALQWLPEYTHFNLIK